MNRLPSAVGRVISVRSILRRWTTLHLLVDLGRISWAPPISRGANIPVLQPGVLSHFGGCHPEHRRERLSTQDLARQRHAFERLAGGLELLLHLLSQDRHLGSCVFRAVLKRDNRGQFLGQERPPLLVSAGPGAQLP